MTTDKLYGAASAYFLVGALWTYLYAIVQYFYPGSFAMGGTPVTAVPMLNLLYFSMMALTTSGFGNVAPVLPPAQSLAVLEQIFGGQGVRVPIYLVARLSSSRSRGVSCS